MRIDQWKCDCCGKEYRESQGATVQYFVDHRDDCEFVDLCSTCLRDAVQKTVPFLTSNERRGLFKK